MFKHEGLLARGANIQHLRREAKALMLQQCQTALRRGGLLLAGGSTGGIKQSLKSYGSLLGDLVNRSQVVGQSGPLISTSCCLHIKGDLEHSMGQEKSFNFTEAFNVYINDLS
ncbi:unnamed protein product [Rangifer tarandus platyrhynchus]|uniref:Uncharacterized protein n=1 Tax=Rangifer tarandus platyrhynchus TaxID=3082113 RepID=A0AC59YBR4_RANTA